MQLNRRNFLTLLGITPLSVNLFGNIENSTVFGKPFTTVYKVTDYDQTSAYHRIPDYLRLKYKVGQTTIPKIGRIYTYDSAEVAKRKYGLFNCPTTVFHFKLFKCRTKDYIRADVFANVTANRRYLESFWNGNFVENNNVPILLCKSIDVLEEINA